MIHDYYDTHNVEMTMEVDIARIVDVEKMTMVVVHKDPLLLDIVYQMLVLIDHVVLELVEKVVQFED